jgi:hypothetical protein
MNRSLPLALLIALGSLFLLLPRSAVASDWIEVVRCDSVLVGGVPLPRIQFTLHNADPTQNQGNVICAVRFIPQPDGSPGDTCRAVSAVAPSPWGAHIESVTQGVTYANLDGNQPCLSPGQSLTGFQLILSKAQSCCYFVTFYGWLFEPWAEETDCFTCDRPVPSRPATWGQVKSIYRQ